jgi:hypothetical protein
MVGRSILRLTRPCARMTSLGLIRSNWSVPVVYHVVWRGIREIFVRAAMLTGGNSFIFNEASGMVHMCSHPACNYDPNSLPPVCVGRL